MIAKRIKELLEREHMTWQVLAERADIPIETMRNIYYGKVKNPSSLTMLSIARVFQCSINFLLGETVELEDEANLLYCYRKCGHHGKNRLQMLAKYELETVEAEKECLETHCIPCIVPKELFKEGMRYTATDIRILDTVEPNAYMALYIPNNDWTPKYCKEDEILLERRFPHNGEDALFMREGRLYFRTYIEEKNKYILRYMNDMEDDFVYRRMDKFTCIGTAVGVVRI